MEGGQEGREEGGREREEVRKGERKREEERGREGCQAFSSVSTASNKHWSGHEAKNSMYGCGACNGLIDLHLAIG